MHDNSKCLNRNYMYSDNQVVLSCLILSINLLNTEIRRQLFRVIVANVCMYDVYQTQYSSQLSAYPGETFRVSIKAFDELERPTAAVLRLSERDVSGDNNLYLCTCI